MRAIDDGKVCALVLLDLSAAFDTVDHAILLRILEHRFGVKSEALNWFKSYLADRTQTFQVNTQQSGPHAVDCSVPQGSVLGPQEFIAYTEDLGHLIDRHQVRHHLYADDTQIYDPSSTTDTADVVVRLKDCVEATRVWCASRRLQLNPSKTEIIWFGSKASLNKISNLDLSLPIGSEVIKPSATVRDLGVIFDKELSMQQHISKITSACFYQLRRLKPIRRILGQHIAANLVLAFVSSRLDYCNAVLAGLPKSTTEPLQRVQNAAARLITGIGPRDHITPALQGLHWLWVSDRITFKLCVIMH